MKSFFREMKEPLMTFVLYSDFIGASGVLCSHDVGGTCCSVLQSAFKYLTSSYFRCLQA